MVVLGCIAAFVARQAKGRALAFLWAFVVWDVSYYLWLRLTIGWPSSLICPDVLFLIPVPWVAQVWFPVLVSCLIILVIWLRSGERHELWRS